MSEGQLSRSGVDRAAILLLALGEQDRRAGAAPPRGARRATGGRRHGEAVGRVARRGVDRAVDVLQHVEQQTSFGIGTDDYIRKVLNEALGADKAGGVIDRILRGRSSRGLEALKWMEPKAVCAMLRNEHPQIISIVLSYLEAEQAAVVLTQLPEATRGDILMRIATLDSVHPTALNELDEVLEKQFCGTGAGATDGGFGGPKAAAEILNLIGTAQEGRRSWRRSPRSTNH